MGSLEGMSDQLRPLLLFPWSDCARVTPATASFLVPARPRETAVGWEFFLQMRKFCEHSPLIFSLYRTLVHPLHSKDYMPQLDAPAPCQGGR